MTRKPAQVFHPGDFIREELESRSWSQTDLAEIMGRPVPVINLIINGNKRVTAETAHELGEAFSTSAEMWMNLQSAYDLGQATGPNGVVCERAKLYEIAPIKEMVKRGWIRPTAGPHELENELKQFFGVESLDSLDIQIAARQSASPTMTGAQIAWGRRAVQISRLVKAEKFNMARFKKGLPGIAALTRHPEQVREVPAAIAELGVRLVIVEHLMHTKIDGAALWPSPSTPVVALSVRYDRIDHFWHTLFHELIHILHEDSLHVDVDLMTGEVSGEHDQAVEDRANREAAAMIIDTEKLESFILRKRPFFSKNTIVQFANTIKVHPGIIAGQLQFRGAIKFSMNREMLVKVRDLATSATLTDGWGQQLPT